MTPIEQLKENYYAALEAADMAEAQASRAATIAAEKDTDQERAKYGALMAARAAEQARAAAKDAATATANLDELRTEAFKTIAEVHADYAEDWADYAAKAVQEVTNWTTLEELDEEIDW